MPNTFQIADYFDLAMVKGIPPKIIWLRQGNLSTTELAEVLKKFQEAIKHFVNSLEAKEMLCLEIGFEK